MKHRKIPQKKVRCQSILCLGVVVLLFIGFFIPKNSLADDLSECMTGMMQHADDSMTIGALRLQCEKQIHGGTYTHRIRNPRLFLNGSEGDKEHVLQAFTLMSHKPNYILMGAYNSANYDPTVYQEQLDDPSINVDDTEAQFQISVKVPLAVILFDTMDIYAAYTNHSFWQLYNDSSAPFRETNHEPEGQLQFNTKWEFFGFTNTANMFGIVHQSNGRGGVLSRSWNRLYAHFLVERGNLGLTVKPWYRLPEDDVDDDNPDITDYLGHYEIRAAYKWNNHVFSAMSRNNLESGFEKGAVELSWSFPLWDYPYLKGYVQYFTGYGESLIDYDKNVNKIGVGVSITDWL